MLPAERATAILLLIEEIERERDNTSDNRKRAVLDSEVKQLRAMHMRLMAEMNAPGPATNEQTLE